jgi:hypothetical protein
VHRGALAFHHVLVERRRAPHGLTGVVDDEVEAVVRREELVAERVDARRVAQVEAEDLEAVRPLLEVGLARVARGRVAREARRDDEPRAGAEELEAGLVADLDAAAGEERGTAAEIGELRALREVEIAAGGTELIVEVMERGVVLLAHVAVPLFDRLAELRIVDVALLEPLGGEDVRRVEHRLAAQRADAADVEHFLFLLHGGRLALAGRGLDHLPARLRVGVVDERGGGEEALALLGRERGEEPAVGDDALEQLGGRADCVAQVVRIGGVPGERMLGTGHLRKIAERRGRSPYDQGFAESRDGMQIGCLPPSSARIRRPTQAHVL